MKQTTGRVHGAVLLAYTVAALLLTWPLARHFATHVPGDGIDDPALAWNLWWIKARLVDQLQPDIFHMGWMFHPIQINLAFFTLTPLNGLLSIPLQLAFGLVPAINLLVIATFALSGYGAYLLVRYIFSPFAERPQGWALHAAALAAGFLYAFAAPKLFYVALGQYNIMSSQWLPFCALYVVALLRAPSVQAGAHAGAWAALFLILQAWAELTFASFLILFIALAALAALIIILRDGHRLRPLVTGFGLMALLFVVGMLPYLVAMAPDLLRNGDFFGSGGGFADLYSADLAGFLFPTRLHPWIGEWVATLPFPNDKGQQVFLGYVAPLLGLVGLLWLWKRARGQALFWGAATLGFWALSLGPSLRWMGRDLGIPGPFTLVNLLPFFNGNRYPSRYAVPLLLCVGVLMAAGLLAMLERRRLHMRGALWASAGAVALITLESISTPLPLSDFRIPQIYQLLADEPGDGALLELPTGWRNGARVLGRSDILIMMQQWRQTAHGKPRLGGNTSRNPPQKFQYYTEHPLMGSLIALMNSDQPGLEGIADRVDDLIARHAPTAAQELADLGIRWVTLHEEKATAPLIRFVEEALPLELVDVRTELDWSGAPETIRLYRVRPAPAVLPRTFALAGPGASDNAFAFLGEGWATARNATDRYANKTRAMLLLPLPEEGGIVTLSPTAEGTPPQVRVGGVPLALLPADGRVDAYTLPPGVAAAPVDVVELRFAGEGLPVQGLVQAASPVGTTGVALPPGVALFARSAGEPTGNLAQLWVNGVDVAPGSRGFNLAALDAQGTLLEAAAFDTFSNDAEAAHMAAWLRAWPPGTIIMGAVADEGSYHLTADAISALGDVGLAPGGLDHFRRSHAFIGVAGAPPGSALAAQSSVHSASVWLGAPVEGARVYGPVNAVRVRNNW
jgi:hypothetical protein